MTTTESQTTATAEAPSSAFCQPVAENAAPLRSIPVPETDHARFYKLAEAADLLGCSQRKVTMLIQEGRLNALRLGKQHRFRREDLLSLLTSR